MLLAEVNHRVANSLALVGSLVRMQAGAVTEPGAKAALAETQARITAIANLHRSLYTSTDVQHRRSRGLSGNARLGELGQFDHSLGPDARRQARCRARLDQDGSSAVSVGMIATELVTNALKYAYPVGEGEVRVSVSRAPSNQITLSVADDGVGWTGQGAAKGSGLGAKIIAAMSKSLGSSLEYRSQPVGTLASITFDEKLG
jgi:two-component sensor histidine kinase